MVRKLLLASVGAIALAGSAFAADLPSRAPPPVYIPPAPIFTWTGIYIGGQVGYAWGKTNTTLGDNFGDFISFNSPTIDGVIGGAHVGYNLQLSQFVIGLEGSVDGSSLKRTVNSNPFIGGVLVVPTTLTGNLGVQGSIRGRLGYAWDRVLIYATGGVAFAGVNGSIYTPFGYDSFSNTRVGWTVGGGLEYAITNNWSVRAEYRYSQFGTSNIYANNSFALPGLAAVGAYGRRKLEENQVQVGFSYKFDTAPPVPVVAKY
jgi:outer membrane immunogenic protein